MMAARSGTSAESGTVKAIFQQWFTQTELKNGGAAEKSTVAVTCQR
jgi:hypothetical protein